MFTRIVLSVAGIAIVFMGVWFTPRIKADLPTAQAEKKAPGTIKLQIRTLTPEAPKTDQVQFKSSEDVEVQILATNASSETVSLTQSSWFVHYLTELSRSGEPVAYSKAMQQRLTESRRMEKDLANPNAIVRDSSFVTRLLPNEQRQTARIFLSSYYDKLEPGVYLLKVQFRQPNGPKIESEPIMFEIVP